MREMGSGPCYSHYTLYSLHSPVTSCSLVLPVIPRWDLSRCQYPYMTPEDVDLPSSGQARKKSQVSWLSVSCSLLYSPTS